MRGGCSRTSRAGLLPHTVHRSVFCICILYFAYRILYGDEDVHVLGLDYYLTQYTGPCPFRPKIASEARNQPEDPAGLP